jgi:hypothetical protein
MTYRWDHVSSGVWALTDDQTGLVRAAVTRLGPYPGDTRVKFRITGPAVDELNEFESVDEAKTAAEGIVEHVERWTWAESSIGQWQYVDRRGTAWAEVTRTEPEEPEPAAEYRIRGRLVAQERDFASLQEAKNAVEALARKGRNTTTG